MISSFFIKRPVFAGVIAILITIAGVIAVMELPIQQYPQVAPPEVVINTVYPGASAETLEKTVTQVIEQKMTGLQNLRYFSSRSNSNGTASITLTFEIGTEPDIAQIQVQNKLSEAVPSLPSQVQQLGIKVNKSIGNFQLVTSFYSSDGKVSQQEISDFITTRISEPIERIRGVGRVQVFGPQNAMRIWLNPKKMNFYQITASDVFAQIGNQNKQLSSGQIGGAPSIDAQQLNATIIAKGLYTKVEDFQNIFLKVLPDGSRLLLKDIARVEIGSESYNTVKRYKGKNAAGFGMYLSAGANALDTIELVKKELKKLEPSFPPGVEVSFPVDASPFIKTSIAGVIQTLAIAMILVVLVMYLFLQSFTATLIPVISIPVVLLGTFAIMLASGFSINVLTLFACVLSIGMLVDDVIVVTENFKSRLENNKDIEPEKAAKETMKQLSGALIGTTMVVWAVFTPMLFFSGSSGVIYKNFSITILAAMTLSLFIALTLAPSLCRSLVKKGTQENFFFRKFNLFFDKTQNKYESSLNSFLSKTKTSFVLFVGLLLVTGFLFYKIPGTFLPDEDQGRVFTLVQGPQNATFNRMLPVIKKVEKFFLEDSKDAIKDIFTVIGFSFSGQGQNTAIGFVNFKDYDKRSDDVNSVFSIAKRANKEFAKIEDARVFVLVPPPISQLGNANGFKFQLVDSAGLGYDKLVDAKNQFLGLTSKDNQFASARANALPSNPQYKLNLDERRALAYKIPIAELNTTLSSAWGGSYVNDFIEDGRVKRVFIQGDKEYRMKPDDVSLWYVRNTQGKMISLGDVTSGAWSYGAPQLQRFNGNSSIEIQGQASPGVTTDTIMNKIMKLKEKLPRGFDIEWTGLSFEEKASGSQVVILYSLAIVAIFLSLAALYESWTIPFSILLVLPLGILGASLSTWLAGEANDVYFKVGILLTLALTAKNAILIVEFARSLVDDGEDLKDAVVKACKERFRPILMTSLTFFLGIIPLVFSSGPGSGAQNSIGAGLVGGIIAITFLVIYFSPLFFIAIMKLRRKK